MDFSQLPLDGFAPKDKKIINDNPGKSIYDLTMLGISAKAAQKLTEIEDSLKVKETPETAQVAKPIRVEANNPSLQPVLMGQPSTTLDTSVWVYNSKTGLRQYMSGKAADRLCRKHPNQYKKVSG